MRQRIRDFFDVVKLRLRLHDMTNEAHNWRFKAEWMAYQIVRAHEGEREARLVASKLIEKYKAQEELEAAYAAYRKRKKDFESNDKNLREKEGETSIPCDDQRRENYGSGT